MFRRESFLARMTPRGDSPCWLRHVIAHRVVEQQARPEGVPDRFSYALFVDSSLDTAQCEGLYRFDPQNGLVLAADFNTFLDKILANTYDRDTEGLY